MTPLNECVTCGLDFASIRAFDLHRVGKFPQSGPSEWRDRVAAGLVERFDDWRPEHGRRCLDEDEMIAAGLERDERGRWRLELTPEDRARLTRSRTALRAAADDSEPLRGARRAR